MNRGTGGLRRFATIAAAAGALTTLMLAPLARAAGPGVVDPPGATTATEPKVESIKAPMDDGVLLDGWLARPAQATARRLPTILWASPYFGQMAPLRGTGDDPASWNEADPNTGGAPPVQLLLDSGYAVAMVNIRGSGNSGGCMDMWGPREQKDMGELVDWVSAQPWSNGRVGMMGLSWDSGTAIEAATQVPKALKAIIVGGIFSDVYTLEHTPNGATVTPTMPYRTAIEAVESPVPPRSTDPSYMAAHANVVADRVCPEYVHIATADQADPVADHRDATFYGPRRLIDRFDRIRAAVLIAHGFRDCGHCWQEDLAWGALTRAPKHMLTGTWQHEWPDQNSTNASYAVPRDVWLREVVDWFDDYVKGNGRSPDAGSVDYQDFDGAWHETTSWPPSGAREEGLYLGGDGHLAPSPVAGTKTFVASPTTRVLQSDDTHGGTSVVCDPTGQTAAVYAGAPLAAPIDIAGDPFAWLRLSSSQQGGEVRVSMVDLAPEFTCDGTMASGWRYLTAGSVDLRYADANLDAIPFPTSGAKSVRVELADLAVTVPAGHRIGLVVSGITETETVPSQFSPVVGVHGDGGADASQLILPITSGSTGGRGPTGSYPARPFSPS